jgi:hypothetical protein
LSNNKKTNERYVGQVPVEDLQKKFFTQFDYYFWIHKASALLFFIHNKENIKNVKFQEDRYDEDVILQSLKMELHMSVFHSTESLFRQVFSIIYNPELPWIWIARCQPRDLLDLINKTKEEGLASIEQSPEEWLRVNLYPTIDREHERYYRSLKSAEFVVKYLNYMAKEYLDHIEYNSYKHGLHCFPGILQIQATNDTTSKAEFEGESDVIEFLEFRDYQDKDGKCKKVNLTYKGYDYARDYNKIKMNSAIMYNIFNKRGLDAKQAPDNSAVKRPLKFGYFYFDDWKLSDFSDTANGEQGKNVIRRFSY